MTYGPVMTLREVRTPQAERPRKRVALIAHDNKKLDLAEWALLQP